MLQWRGHCLRPLKHLYLARLRAERFSVLQTGEMTGLRILSAVYVAILSSHCGVEGLEPKSLFVIGDSYVDTGNLQRGTYPWKFPYGMFAGRPSGRLSDGKVLTDFVASFFRLPSPLPYADKSGDPRQRKFGMNFATGGAGVLQSAVNSPTTTAQIQELEQQVNKRLFSREDLFSSVLLYSASGNDYTMYYLRGGSDQGLPSFVQSVVNQISLDITTLYAMGFRRFAVVNLGPVGCLPEITIASSYQSCNGTVNRISLLHNRLLEDQLNGISNKYSDSKISVLDQYSGVMAIIQDPGRLQDPLRPCCAGFCGFSDRNGRPLYSVCNHPDSSLFWDSLHPTEAGWRFLMARFFPVLSSLKA